MKKKILGMELSTSRILVVLLAVAAFLFPVVVKQTYYIQIMITLLFYCYWASSWNIIGGYAGQFAMGNGVYIGIGAYAAILFYLEGFGSPWIGMIIGGLISVVCAYVISKPCFHLSGTYFSLATVAFLHIVRYIILGSDSIFGMKTQGGLGLIIPYTGRWQDMQLPSKQAYYYLILVMLVLVMLLSNAIRKSKMGYYLAAIKTNQGAASTIGVNVPKYKMMAQCISAFCMALGGSVFTFFLLNISPYKVLSYELSLEIMTYCVIGGVGTIWGPVLGAMLLGLISEVLRVRMGSDIAPLAFVIYGVVMIIIVRFAPGGLHQLIQNLIEKIRNKIKMKKEALPVGKEASE